jgi:hypothetical protein
MSRISLAGIALVVTAVGCGQDATGPNPRPVVEPPTPRASVFESLSPTSGAGIVGTAVPYQPTVIVIDGAGHPLANVLVKFAFVSEEPEAQVGSISRSEALTNAEGIASAGEWTLSTKAGPNFLQATIVGAGPLFFRADGRPDAPVSLGWLSDMEGQVGLAGMTVQPPRLQVMDRFGNSVAGIPVTFAITAGGGTLEGAEMVTTDNGVSALRWTLGANLGANTITAHALELQSIEFTIQAIVASGIYDLTMVDGGIGWDVASAFVAFTDDGHFVANTKYSDDWLWVASGTYVISGSSVVLTYAWGEEELGTLIDGVLVLDRWDNTCAPAPRQFHYHIRD